MGESRKPTFCLNFDNSIRLEFHGSTITSDAGLLAYREFDHINEDTNDADRLCIDPAMRRVVGGRAVEKTVASASQMGRFETEVLTTPDNLKSLMQLSGMWIDRLRSAESRRRIVLGMDSSVSETHANQEGSAYEEDWPVLQHARNSRRMD